MWVLLNSFKSSRQEELTAVGEEGSRQAAPACLCSALVSAPTTSVYGLGSSFCVLWRLRIYLCLATAWQQLLVPRYSVPDSPSAAQETVALSFVCISPTGDDTAVAYDPALWLVQPSPARARLSS